MLRRAAPWFAISELHRIEADFLVPSPEKAVVRNLVLIVPFSTIQVHAGQLCELFSSVSVVRGTFLNLLKRGEAKREEDHEQQEDESSNEGEKVQSTSAAPPVNENAGDGVVDNKKPSLEERLNLNQVEDGSRDFDGDIKQEPKRGDTGGHYKSTGVTRGLTSVTKPPLKEKAYTY